MIKTMLLVSALTFAPIGINTMEEAPVSEVVEDSNLVDKIKDIDWANVDVEVIKEVLSEELAKVFNAETVALIISIVGYIGVAIKLIYDATKAKRTATLTAREVKDAVLKEIESNIEKGIATQVNTKLLEVVKSLDKFDKILEVIAEVSVLQQQDTPESKLAIVECIKKIGAVQSDLTTSTTQIIEEQVKIEQENKEQVLSDIKQMKEDLDDGTQI